MRERTRGVGALAGIVVAGACACGGSSFKAGGTEAGASDDAGRSDAGAGGSVPPSDASAGNEDSGATSGPCPSSMPAMATPARARAGVRIRLEPGPGLRHGRDLHRGSMDLQAPAPGDSARRRDRRSAPLRSRPPRWRALRLARPDLRLPHRSLRVHRRCRPGPTRRVRGRAMALPGARRELPEAPAAARQRVLERWIVVRLRNVHGPRGLRRGLRQRPLADELVRLRALTLTRAGCGRPCRRRRSPRTPGAARRRRRRRRTRRSAPARAPAGRRARGRRRAAFATARR